MGRGRLEAFSDGVIAILITIMVLELRTPQGSDWESLRAVLPVFLSYVLSFVFLGIYWANHHHMLHTVDRVDGKVLWANLHLLFWLSLLPFATAWMGANGFDRTTVAAYNTVLMMAALAYFILTRSLVAHHGRGSTLALAVGRDRKGLYSLLAYVVAIPLTCLGRGPGLAISVGVALVWLVPDRRMERSLEKA